MRVAVIGGGCASLAAAFELTRPEHEGRYQVTVYQMGWRLGGKGASGRGAADRIEEHGLHLWMGCYENAFRIMRECYAELPPNPCRRFSSWLDAFSPAPGVAVTDRAPAGGWDLWFAQWPTSPGLPGDPIPPDGTVFTVEQYLGHSASLLRELVRSAHAMEAGRAGTCETDPVPTGRLTPQGIESAVDALLRYGQLATTTAIFQATDLLRQVVEAWAPPLLRAGTGPLIRLTDALSNVAHLHLARMAASDRALRRVWEVIDLVIAVVRGITLQGLAFDPRGFDAINDYDWREWLQLHGASDSSVESGFLRAIYGLVFAFEDGDMGRPRLAAGVALRGAMRMFFTYRGALFWRMNAGMGEIVIAPLYEVLKRRGVRFEFFHRLDNVGLSAPRVGETPHVEELEFEVQARVRDGEYRPLVNVRGIPAWPAQPDFDQLEDGACLQAEGRAFESPWETRHAGRWTLRVGEDFDLVVLGTSIGALPLVARELIEREPKWRAMVRHVKTVPTQAFQLWMREDVGELGWRHSPVNLSGFAHPFDTWADMSHLIGKESWRHPVRSIAYFCGVLPDPGEPDDVDAEEFRRRQRAVVRENAIRFLDSRIGTLWPAAVRSQQGFRWELLVSATDAPGEAGLPDPLRFDSQYWTANVEPSDRYVLSLPGSCKYRLSPLDLSFDNLTIAGDWTANGFDCGCIEAAVMSGRLAAHAISCQPPLADIIGYDHP